uniref:Protein Lines homolog 1-like n=1 Tax=Podarcis muralis TaxID=64176 RepID=A0A670J913_PODMU|nr:protein Lines homolog 1-like isoform X5 [Podarcis muralis]
MTENTKFSHNWASLQQMYDGMLADALFLKDSHSCAALLNPPISLQYLSSTNRKSWAMSLFSPNTGARKSSDPAFTALKTDDEPDTSESVIRSTCHSREIMLLQLTLIKMMLSKMQSQGVAVESKQKYLEIIRILLKEANIDSKLIHLLLISDKQLSYQASKALVFLVRFQLTEEGSLNSPWFAFCSEALSGFPKSSHVAECLWTLTNVIREILKDEGLCKGGGLQKILTSLDKVLEDFYNRIPSSYSEIAQVSAKATNDLSSFLDLLELLVASRTQAPLNLVCQRMLLLNVSCVLGLVTSPIHDLIKKKAIVLLKKCILHKAGEDLIKGKVPSSSHPNLHFDKDRLVFAGVVLQFVATGWLNHFSLSEKASHYGGRQVKPEVGICCSPAQVTLRALSLVLLKALEVKITDSASEAEARVHLESIMHPLLAFLKSHVGSSHASEHPCAWLSTLFIEQDDDMLEAAKTLLTVHLKFERFWHKAGLSLYHSDDGTWAAFTHQNGCNPHCIFLFLLKSISFDATVLLDFLISSETCFLEYFVRYLKLLVQDWDHFVKISKYFKTTSNGELSFSMMNLPCREKSAYRLDSDLQDASYDPPSGTEILSTSFPNFSALWHTDSQAVKPSRSNLLQESDNTSLVGALQRLVDYESSEDSEVEWIGEESLADMRQTPLDRTCAEVTGLMDVDGQTERCVLPQDTSSPFHSTILLNKLGSEEGVLQKSVKCFQQVQESVSRLHRRNLFPYNPSALLKLLTSVDTISSEHRSASKKSKV